MPEIEMAPIGTGLKDNLSAVEIPPIVVAEIDRVGRVDEVASLPPVTVPLLDVPLSTRASEATLADIRVGTDRLDVPLSSRASEATALAIRTGTDRLDIPLSTRASEATLATRLSETAFTSRWDAGVFGWDGTTARKLKTDADGELQVDVVSSALPAGAATEATLAGVRVGTDRLDVPLSSRASEATVAGIRAGTDRLDVMLSSRASEATLATRASEATLAGIKAKTDLLTFDPAGNLNVALPPGAIAVIDEVTTSKSHGWDGTTWQPIKTDTAGELQVDVVSSALPAGAATEATLAGVRAGTDRLDVLLSSRASEATLATRLSEATFTARWDGGVYGWDGTTARKLKTDTAGELQIDVLTAPPASYLTDSVMAYGWDGTTGQKIKTDTAGRLETVTTATVNPPALDVPLSSRASEATLAGIKAKTDLLSFDPAGNLNVALPPGAIAVIDEVAVSKAHGWDGTAWQPIKTDTAGELQVDVVSSALPAGAATEATLAGIKTGTDRLDVALSTRASESTLAGIKVGTDRLDVPLSTRASESTLAGVKVGTDRLDVALSSRASEATLATRLADATFAGRWDAGIYGWDGAAPQKIKTDTAGRLETVTTATVNPPALDVPLSTRAAEATLLGVKAGTDRLDVALSTRAADRTAATAPFAVRLSDGTAFYDAAKSGQLPATLTPAGNLKTAVVEPLPPGLNEIGYARVWMPDTLPRPTYHVINDGGVAAYWTRTIGIGKFFWQVPGAIRDMAVYIKNVGTVTRHVTFGFYDCPGGQRYGGWTQPVAAGYEGWLWIYNWPAHAIYQWKATGIFVCIDALEPDLWIAADKLAPDDMFSVHGFAYPFWLDEAGVGRHGGRLLIRLICYTGPRSTVVTGTVDIGHRRTTARRWFATAPPAHATMYTHWHNTVGLNKKTYIVWAPAQPVTVTLQVDPGDDTWYDHPAATDITTTPGVIKVISTDDLFVRSRLKIVTGPVAPPEIRAFLVAQA